MWSTILVLGCTSNPPGDKPIADVVAESGNLIASPVAFTFNDADRGATVTGTVTLHNQGTGALDITSVSVADATGAFAAVAPGPMTLNPAGSADIALTFTPASVGPASGEMRVESNDPDSPLLRVALAGTGHGPQIAVDPESVDLGNITVGCTAETLFTVANDGDAPLTITAIAITEAPAEIQLGETNLPWTLQPGESTGVSLWYAPLQHADDGGSIRVYSDDPLAPVLDLPVHGTGIILEEQTDTFVQGSESTLDLLVSVGDVTEGDEDRAVEALTRYTDTLTAANIDYHLSIINTYGCHAGDLPFLDRDTPAANRASDIAIAVDATNQSTAQADQAMTHMAYSVYHDGDGMYDCNVGFFRNGAPLALFAILAGRDTSANFEYSLGDVTDFVGGIGNLVAYAIAPPDDGGCGSLEGNDDWTDLADDTSGIFFSYCDTDWNADVDMVAARTHGERDWFELSSVPVPDTLSVFVEGDPVVSGWTYEAADNAIHFDPASVPAPGYGIDVGYVLYSATCD